VLSVQQQSEKDQQTRALWETHLTK